MMQSTEEAFAEWFKRGTGHEPYPFPVRFACVLPSPLGRRDESLVVEMGIKSHHSKVGNLNDRF